MTHFAPHVNLLSHPPHFWLPEVSGARYGARSLLNNAVGQIGGQARHPQERGSATPRVGMAGLRTPRVAMIWSSR